MLHRRLWYALVVTLCILLRTIHAFVHFVVRVFDCLPLQLLQPLRDSYQLVQFLLPFLMFLTFEVLTSSRTPVWPELEIMFGIRLEDNVISILPSHIFTDLNILIDQVLLNSCGLRLLQHRHPDQGGQVTPALLPAVLVDQGGHNQRALHRVPQLLVVQQVMSPLRL